MNVNKKSIADAAYIKALEEKCKGKPQGGSPAEKEWEQLNKLPKRKPGEKNLGLLDEI
jgi:hypothetical protein